MRNSDRTTKVLLGLIALFLGILVAKSLFMGAPQAVAQTTAKQPTGVSVLQNYDQMMQNPDSGDVMGYRTMPVSSIAINSKDKVRGVSVIDSAQSFVVQFDDRLEVYRISTLNLTTIAAQKTAAENQ